MSMVVNLRGRSLTRRNLLLRDSLSFVSLVALTVVLFGLTLLLFHSFTAHRDALARRWAERGTQNMRDGRPEQAITALRTALTYAPDDRGYELLFAQALGEAGRTDESYAYFMTLWEGQPGSGFINLELARLAAKRGDRTSAIEFYRASIYGTWEGDGVVRRSQVRLELARYLIDARQLDPARMELLIAAGNSPETAEFDRTIADLLSEAQDDADASKYYRKAVAAAPRDFATLASAGRFAYNNGDFAGAQKLLSRAEAVRAERREPVDTELSPMRANAARVRELLPGSDSPSRENAGRVHLAQKIAKKRLDACATPSMGENANAVIQTLTARWLGPDGTADGAALRDPGVQADVMRLVFDTELATAKICSAATGDDALLLFAAKVARPSALGTAETAVSPGAKR